MEGMAKEGKSPSDAVKQLQRARGRRGEQGPSKSAVYRFFQGATYARDAGERRGRPAKLSSRCMGELNKVRKALIKKANSEYHVTWGDVCKGGKQVVVKKKIMKKR